MCNGRICERASQKVKIGTSEYWVRPLCWPTTDPDTIIKDRAVERLNAGRSPHFDGRTCICGTRIYAQDVMDIHLDSRFQEDICEDYCVTCLNKKIRGVA